MKKVIITGANGFVGSWLCKELLAHNVEIIAIIKDDNEEVGNITQYKNVNIVYCDLGEIVKIKETISERDIDTFYHLAWAGSTGKIRADYELQLLNVKYSCDCAKVAKELGCKKFLCAGTITEKIIENLFQLEAKSENMIYGVAKHTTHTMLEVICKQLKLDYVWMRFSNIYGPFNMSGNIVNYTLNEMVKGNVPTFSKGEQPYDLMYIKDLVRAMYKLGESNNTKTCYFLGSEECRLLKDYLIEISDVFGEGCSIGLGKRPEDGIVYHKDWFNIEELQKDTGFKSQYTFSDGITETIEWIKKGEV